MKKREMVDRKTRAGDITLRTRIGSERAAKGKSIVPDDVVKKTCGL